MIDDDDDDGLWRLLASSEFKVPQKGLLARRRYDDDVFCLFCVNRPWARVTFPLARVTFPLARVTFPLARVTFPLSCDPLAFFVQSWFGLLFR